MECSECAMQVTDVEPTVQLLTELQGGLKPLKNPNPTSSLLQASNVDGFSTALLEFILALGLNSIRH